MSSLKIPLSSPDITEKEISAVVRVLKSGRLSLGGETKAFEEEWAHYVGAGHAVSVSSGTAGLHCVMRALEIGEGDEVITSPFSFIASANCILFEKATPVFVDIDPATLCLDPSKIEEKITPRTKALLVVHLLGTACVMDRILAIARQHRLYVIEDACEAVGAMANGCHVGTRGDAGIYAFYPNKQMTTAEGGMIVSANRQLADICRSLRNQGRDLQDGNVFERLGYNYRLSEIHAALGRVQLSRLEQILAKRLQVAKWYMKALKDCEEIILPPGTGDPSASWFIYLIQLSKKFNGEDRNHVRRELAKKGIETGAYFAPIHLQRFYREQFGFREGDYPVTESVAQRTIALPFYNQLSCNGVNYVAGRLISHLELVGEKVND